jgi:hypothetical protein
MSNDPTWNYFNNRKRGSERRALGLATGMGNPHAAEALRADYANSDERREGPGMNTMEYLVKLASNGATVHIGRGEGTVPFKIALTDGDWGASWQGSVLPALFASAVGEWEEFHAYGIK